MAEEPIGTVFVDVTVNDAAVRSDVESAFAKAFQARVEFSGTQIQSAFQTALKSAGPLVATASVVFDDAGIVKQVERTQKQITAVEKREQEKRLTDNNRGRVRRLNLARDEARQIRVINERTQNDLLRAEAVTLRQRENNLARAAAADLAYNRRVALNAERTYQQLLRLNRQPIVLRVTDNLAQVSQSLRGFEATTSRVLRASLLSFTAFSAGVTLAVGAAATAGVAAFARLELAATRAGAVVASQRLSDELREQGRAVSNFADVTEDARRRIQARSEEVALSTLFNPTEVAQGTQALLQAGQDVESALVNISTAANFAQVNELDLVDASDRLAAGLAAAGLGAQDSARLIDQISFTAQSALGNAGDYLEAFANRGASSFRTYGQGIEETLTLLQLLGQTGVTGRSAGTQASIVIRDIAKAADRSGPAFKRYGIAVKSAATPGVTFNETLVSLASAIDAAQKGNRLAKLRKDLGFMDRSFGSILQVIPKVNELGKTGLDDFAEGLRNSTGTVARQAEVLRGTIAFQFDNLRDTFTVAFGRFGEQAADEVSQLFDAFGGTGGLLDQATPTIERFGRAFGRLVGRVAEFVQTDNFTNGIQTLVEAIQVTLRGVGDSFRAFSSAFRDGADAQSTFESFADTVLAFAQVSARVLPVVAGIIGDIVDFLIDNADAFESFAKLTLGVYALNKAFTLLVAPAAAASKAILSVRSAAIAAGTAQAAGTASTGLGAIAAQLGLINTRALDAAKHVKALQGVAAASGAASGGAAASGASIGTGSAAVAGSASSLGAVATAGAAATAAVVAFAGAAKGAFDEFKRQSSTVENFKVSLEASGVVLKGIGQTLLSLVEFVFRFGDAIGTAFARFIGGYLETFGGFVSSIDQLLKGNFIEAFLRAGDAAANALLIPIRTAVAFVIDSFGALFDSLGRIPKIGDDFEGLADSFYDVGESVADFRIRMADLNTEAEEVPKKAKLASNGIRGIGKIAGAAAAKVYDLQAALATTGLDSQGRLARPFAAFRPPAVTRAPRSSNNEITAPDPGIVDNGSGSGSGSQRDLSAEAAARVEALRFAARNRLTNQLIDRIDKAGAKGYKATRFEAALLERALPGVEKALERQRERVNQLNTALQDLRSTQIAGTKAFSDAAFQLDQQIKSLQLQRLDAIIGGTPDTDPAIAAIDAQIQALQQQTERTNLVESLQLDPLRRKLEETFNPVRELPFDQIVAQFQQLNSQQTAQQAQLSETERVQKLLTETNAAATDRFRRVDEAARAAAASVGSVGAAASQATTSVQELTAANTNLASEGGDLTGTLASGITSGQDQVSAAIGQLLSSARNQLATAILVGGPLQQAARLLGFTTALSFAQGVRAGFRERVIPELRVLLGSTALVFSQLALTESPLSVTARSLGTSIMTSLLAGMRDKFGQKGSPAGTIAHFLNVEIPEQIRQLKGPVAYDATILVPAGQAIMGGLDQGLRAGFGTVASFLRDVAPQIEETVSPGLFSDATKQFMVDVALGKTPDPNQFYQDFLPSTVFGDFSGPLDPSLSFLHKTLSLADTTSMAQHLAKLFGLTVTSTDRAAGTLTSSGKVSDHTFGTAADIAGSASATDRMVAAIAPLYGDIFKQIIWHNKDVNRGFFVPDHEDHAHVAWLTGGGFDKYSGKKGASGFDIPGAPSIIDRAINQAAQATGVPVRLLAAIAKAESGFDPRAGSPAGAQGLFQLIPSTAASLGVKNVFDPFQNALGGAKYIKQQLAAFGGNLQLALAAYNAGPGNAATALTSFGETIEYVKRIKRFLADFGGFRAAGGPVDRNRPYIVGERGPELFTPTQSGRITNASDTARLTGAQPGNMDNRQYVINTAATDPQAILALLRARDARELQRVNIR